MRLNFLLNANTRICAEPFPRRQVTSPSHTPLLPLKLRRRHMREAFSLSKSHAIRGHSTANAEILRHFRPFPETGFRKTKQIESLMLALRRFILEATVFITELWNRLSARWANETPKTILLTCVSQLLGIATRGLQFESEGFHQQNEGNSPI